MTPTRAVPTTTALFDLLTDPDGSGHAAAALDGDAVARDYACVDHLEERGQNVVPFAVGERHLVQTETLYWVGEIVAITGGFVVLEQASWVHWTGRLSTVVSRWSFAGKGWPTGARRPRTEYVGRVIVSLSKIVDSIPGPWALPTESVTA